MRLFYIKNLTNKLAILQLILVQQCDVVYMANVMLSMAASHAYVQDQVVGRVVAMKKNLCVVLMERFMTTSAT